jgi:hypothetical protein
VSDRRGRNLLGDEDRMVGSLMGELDAPERVLLVRGAMFVDV